MSTISRKHLSKLTFCMFLIFILLSDGAVEATNRELQLFDHAYHSYLSYRPEKAVEEFRIFLQEFPDSSAKDAAMFWLAKSFLQTKAIEEAKKTFAYLREHFPESPFICFIAIELETIGNTSEEHGAVKTIVGKEAEQKPVLAGIPVATAVSIEQKAFYVTDIPYTNATLTGEKTSSAKDTDREKTAQDTPLSSNMKHDEKITVYALQVGSFKNKESALTLRKSLQKRFSGKKVTICQQEDFFKVRITGFNNIEEVNSMLHAGIDGLIVKTGEKACGIENQSLALLP